jgi:RHS repeat-associated protein
VHDADIGAKQRPTELPSGIINMRARVYDPYTGTFLQTDPIPGADANAYGYTDGDPVNETDLTGAASHFSNYAWAALALKDGRWADSRNNMKTMLDWMASEQSNIGTGGRAVMLASIRSTADTGVAVDLASGATATSGRRRGTSV